MSMPRTIIATRPVSPLGERSAAIAVDCSARCETGASATVPRSLRSGVYRGASDAAHSTDCPPCEWPASTTRLLSRGSSLRAARAASSTEWPSERPIRYGWAPGVPSPS